MSKKITSLLMMMLGLFMSTSAFAQLEEFGENALAIGGAIIELKTDTWYYLFQGRGSGQSDSQYQNCAEGEIPDNQGGLMTDCGVGNQVLKKDYNPVLSNVTAETAAPYLVRFVEVEEGTGRYNIQFGTGNWLSAPNGTGNSKYMTVGNIYDAGTYNVYNIVPGTAHFALNVSDGRGDYQELLDNNGTGNGIVTWGSGQKTSVGGNSVWSIHEVIVTEYDEKDLVGNELKNLADQISGEIANFVGGTLPGCYDSTLLEKIGDLLNNIYMVTPDNPDYEDVTIEMLQSYIEQLNNLYNQLIATKVPYKLANGYYYIKSAMTFSKDVEVTDPETGEQSTETKFFTKYMMTQKNGETIKGVWGTPEDLDIWAPALWYITDKEDGTFDILNVNAQARFNNVATSTAVTLSKDSENMMALDVVATDEDGITYCDIRVSTQEAYDYYYLHTGGHASGAGESGNLVGWATSKNNDGTYGGTEWTFEPISEDKALEIIKAYEPYENRELLLNRYDSLLTAAKENLEIARDVQHVKLIKSVDQLSSPCSDSEEGLHLEYLIDEDLSTFWHSDWHETYTGGTHYVQIDLINPVDREICATFTRRDNSGNQIKKWKICGTDNPEANEEDCEILVEEWSTPWNNKVETFTSDPFSTNGNRYIRLYFLENSSGSVFAHFAEIQLGYDAENPNAQLYHMGELSTNLQKVISNQAGLERDDITIDEYNALKEAYDAFMTKFVDPTELREALNANKDVAEAVVIGNDPGFWSENTSAAAYKTLYGNAEAYDKSGEYTPEQSKNYIEQLNAQADEIFASANKIRTDKWYRIQFAPESDFADHGWDKVAGNASGSSEALFGKYVTASFLDEDGAVTSYIEADEVGLGSNLFFDAKEDIKEDEGLDLFRFVAVGDTAYMLQNKGTGLFIKAAGTSGATTLSIHPSLFNTRAIGFGLNIIAAKNFTGDKQSNLHGQVSNNILVTWDVDYLGSRSALYIEEAEDVAPNYNGSVFNVPAVYGSVNGYCFPMEVSVPENNKDVTLWSVTKIEDTELTMCKLDKVEAGRPFFLVFGNREQYDDEGETEMTTLKHNYEIAATAPDNSHIVKGTFGGKSVGSGVIVAEGNNLIISKRSNTSVPANGAYITNGDEKFNIESTLVINWSETAEDGIQTALANVTKSGAVYTIDGRLVSKKANLNDLSGFGKGIYILNGTKVVVK